MGRRSRTAERGQVAVYAVLLFPLLMLVLSLVLAVGTLEGMRSRLRAQVDMAALTATQALDVPALAAGGPPRLVPDEAAQLARQYLAQNLAASSSLLAGPPGEIAASARVSVTNAPGTDPITGAANSAPTVSIEIRAPVRVPLLGLAGLGPVVTLDIAGSAAART
jgi:Flp pilus assembly protein TadG